MSDQKCEGSCEPHDGDVRPVKVFGGTMPAEGFAFFYCEQAIREDVSRGFRVEVCA